MEITEVERPLTPPFPLLPCLSSTNLRALRVKLLASRTDPRVFDQIGAVIDKPRRMTGHGPSQTRG